MSSLRQSFSVAATNFRQWRGNPRVFITFALAFILCNPRKIELETRGACNPADVDNLLAEMIRFFAPGFKAQSRVKRKP